MIDLWFVLKGVILTEVFTNAAREWGIFNKPRKWLQARSAFARDLLACGECVTVHCGFWVYLYLSYCEIGLFTWTLIFHRVACFIKVLYLLLDWKRANFEEDFMKKISGGRG